MKDEQVQIVSNEQGEPTAVIVPIELWRQIASERETAYLFRSEPNKKRLLAALARKDRMSVEEVAQKLGL